MADEYAITKTTFRIDDQSEIITETTSPIKTQYFKFPAEETCLLVNEQFNYGHVYLYTLRWSCEYDPEVWSGVCHIVSLCRTDANAFTSLIALNNFFSKVGGTKFGTEEFPVASTCLCLGDPSYIYTKTVDGTLKFYVNRGSPTGASRPFKESEVKFRVTRLDAKGTAL